MRDIDLFQAALGLTPPWQVVDCNFAPKERRLDLRLDFPPGSTFPCTGCGKDRKVHDTEEKTWRHLDFFQHAAYLCARRPRTDCPQCGALVVVVPWSRKDSGFTILFEAFVMAMVKEMPVLAVARIIGETDQRIWRIVHHYVEEGRSKEDYFEVTNVGVDETSRAKRHKYVSLFVDLDRSKVLFVTEGRDGEVLKQFADDLHSHGGSPSFIKNLTMDMSAAFISGAKAHIPGAAVTFDRFHVMGVATKALDEVRRAESEDEPGLKGTRYDWLRNPEDLKPSRAQLIQDLSRQKLKTARAYRLRLVLRDFWKQPADAAEGYLKKWYGWAIRCRLEPMQRAARTIKSHWAGIVNYATSRLNNGILESINGLVQAARARARGYRSVRNFVAMIYIVAGKLDLGEAWTAARH
jgi:transposase